MSPMQLLLREAKHASLVGKIVKPASMLETDAAKEKQSIELKQKQDKLKASSSVKVMQSFREKLPAFKMKN
ncbi:hypothetical protein NC652_035743 [Populus alba x Populus x berolinensis]|nr:hypothetical protein NC652_035743 [Populus alba x Populus x berolinensis]